MLFFTGSGVTVETVDYPAIETRRGVQPPQWRRHRQEGCEHDRKGSCKVPPSGNARTVNMLVNATREAIKSTVVHVGHKGWGI